MTAYSPTGYTGDGSTTDFTVSWPYLDADHVECYLDGVETSLFSIPSLGLIRFDTAPSASVAISIKRNTPIEPIAVWNDGAIILGADLNTAFNQALYIAEEAEARTLETISLDSSSTWWDADNKEIRDVVDPTLAQSAATKAYVDANNASSSVAAASAQTSYATEWANKAEDSLVSASAGGDQVDDYSALHHAAKASASAAAAALSESNASTSEGNALSSANAAAASAAELPSLTTKGDIIARDSSSGARVGVGADGTVLTADSTASEGVSWQPAAAGGGPGKGTNSVIRTNAKNIIEDITLSDHEATFTADAGADTLSVGTDDDFADEDTVYLTTTGTLPAGLSTSTEYYIRDITATTCKLAATNGGSAIDITDAGTGTHTIYQAINGMSAGPITIESGHTVTIPEGSTWSIV